MQPRLLAAVLLIVAFALLFTITAKAQNTDTAKVTLGLKNDNLASALKKIEQQSDFRFFYRDADIRPVTHLNLIKGTRTVKQTLELLLQNTPMSYRQIESNILLERKDQPASVEIKGRVVRGADKGMVTNASVFLSNTTIGNKTSNDGTFTLRNVKPGRYNLVVSIVGFETYRQAITVRDNIDLPDIELSPKTIMLAEVSIHSKSWANWERNYGWFKDEFLGKTDIAKDCKILNPEILDFDYDESKSALTASSSDFLEIENEALGYKIKYLLTDFTLVNKVFVSYFLDYRGFVFFEEMKGTPAQEKRWRKRRYQVYESSMMHFLRAAIRKQLDNDGFRVQQLATYPNPGPQSSKLPKTFQKLLSFPLTEQEIIKTTDQPGQYTLGCENDGLYIAYNKNHHFHIIDQLKYLDNPGNTENTLITFNSPCAFFNSNGVISNPNCVMFYGAWSRKRVAELLPTDYETPDDMEPLIENH